MCEQWCRAGTHPARKAHRYVRCHQPQGKAGRSADLPPGNGTWALFEAMIRQNRPAFDFFCQTSTLSIGIRNLMLLYQLDSLATLRLMSDQ